MASELKSYVEQFLLNPAASFNVDEEGNEETSAQIVEGLADDERADEHQQSRSKLRARNEALLLETDSRYKGKKVSRKDLNKDVSYDPELTKYFFAGSDEEEEEYGDDDDGGEEEEEADDNDESEEYERSEGETEENEKISHELTNDLSDQEFENGVDDEEEEEESSDNEDEKDDNDEGFVFDGDFSRFAEDNEEEEEDDSDDSEMEDERGEEEEEEETTEKPEKTQGVSIKKFQSSDEMQEIQKAQCVKEQLGLYDSLFEMRIVMQKVVGGANQLPQFNTYKKFLREKDPNYMKNLASCKSATKKLLTTLLEAQMLLLNQNPETAHVMSGTKTCMDGGSEEITSSEDEEERAKKVVHRKGTKRKLKLEEYEEVLSKRHAAFIPFRDETLNKWYEKTKLLSNNRGRDKFAGFEISALQQLHNVLNNKPQLIRRTQLTGITRGTAYHVLGTDDQNDEKGNKEECDPEIFDDGDFYSRALEEMLKAKMSLSDDMSNVSRKWIEIQKLRKKAKRKVDTKASKGRKLRYEVISKLQQYLAPCNPPKMDDAAINTLFGSLFGKGIGV